MMIYILQVPHQRKPIAWECDSESTALDLLTGDYDEFDGILEAVKDDMVYGMYSDSLDDLKEQFESRGSHHQFFAARQALKELGQ